MQIGQSGVIYFINTPNEFNHVLYSTRIDLHLDPQHHFPPGPWAWSPGAPGGADETYLISTREQHGFLICKAPHDHQGRRLRAHAKFQK